MWRLENDFAVAKAKADEPEEDHDDEPSFTEITLNVHHDPKPGTTGFGLL